MSLSALSPTDAHALLKKLTGAKVTLVTDYMTQRAGSEWFIKTVNMLGGTCVIAVSPTSGPGKGFFAPYKMFEVDMTEDAQPEPAPDPTPVPAPAPAAEPLHRGEFTVDGFDSDTPVFELFLAAAPDSDAAHELFMSYVMEHSEFDTEPLEDLMKAANVVPGAHWTETNVKQMLMLLEDTQASIVDETPEPAPEPAPTPAVVIHPDVKPYVASDLSTPEAPRRRGRPPGAKNKPKDDAPAAPQPAMTALDEDDLAAALDNLPPAAVIVEPTHVIREVPQPVQRTAATVIHPKAYKLAGLVLADLGSDSDPEVVLDDMVIVLRRALGL